MSKYTPEQAAQKLVEMVGKPKFTKEIALDYVYSMMDIENIKVLDDNHFGWLLDDVDEDGWL